MNESVPGSGGGVWGVRPMWKGLESKIYYFPLRNASDFHSVHFHGKLEFGEEVG